MDNSKRTRKPNFSADEIRVLLEEIQVVRALLFSSFSSSTTNPQKTETWKKMAEKVNACGVTVRTVQELKDKWRSMKGAVLNKKRDERETGGGPPPPAVPYEDVILDIIGADTNLVSGIGGDRENPGFDTFADEGSDVSAIPETQQFTDVQHVQPSCSDRYQPTSTSTLRHSTSSPSPSGSGAATPISEGSFMRVEAEAGETILVNFVDGPVNQATQLDLPANIPTPKPVRTINKKRKMAENPFVLNADNQDLVEEWLRSEIDTNKEKKALIELKKRKILLEIKKLEKEIE